MSQPSKLLSVALVGLAGAGAICPLCDRGAATARADQSVEAQVSDTAIVRLHISKMTCGSCATTARLALERLSGVYSAQVTLDDSLGVVRYDPRRLSPQQIAAHLSELTGFGATVLPDPKASPRDERRGSGQGDS